MSKRIALIGGAGFIGHNLALELKKQGHDVHVIDGLHINNLLAFHQSENEIPNKDLYLKIIDEPKSSNHHRLWNKLRGGNRKSF